MRQSVSDNRNLIKSIAILWVMFFHIPVKTSIPVISFIQEIGYGGVDIFIFLAGFGSYYSLEKNGDILQFMKRKLMSLMPSYIPFILIWMAYRKFTDGIYVTEIFGNLTLTGYLAGAANQFNWYVDAIILFYVLAPIIYALFSRTEKFWSVLICTLAVAGLMTIGFWHSDLLIIATRLPLYILGFACASRPFVFSEKLDVIVLNIIMAVGVVMMYVALYVIDVDRWHYGTWWYPFILIVPGLSMDLGMLGRLMPVKSNTIANATFSIFLWHIFIFESVQAKYELEALVWAGLYLMALVCGIVYSHIITKVIKLIGR